MALLSTNINSGHCQGIIAGDVYSPKTGVALVTLKVKGGNADPERDMLLFTNCTLLLTDGEFSDFLSEINEVALKYMKVEAKADSKTRQITLISAPVNEQET